MGSLNKVQTPGEMLEWARKQSRSTEESFLVTEKLDGISISLRYEQRNLVQALTRGDGVIGEDITSNVRRMKGVPLTLDPEKVGADTFHVRGEIVLLKADFSAHFPDKANPRNAASGTSKRLDGKGSEHLSVYCYQLEGLSQLFEQDQFEMLETLGFRVPYWELVHSGQDIVDVWTDYEQLRREALPYEIDGLVVRVNDLVWQLSQGDVHGRPNGAVAFKFTPPARETILREIIWQVGGTGRITPVAVFDPITLVGATVTRASLYNIAYIEQLGVEVGATVLVVRANDVIPRVSRVVKPTGTVAKAPACCPSCGEGVVRDGEYLVCSNLAGCPAQTIGRLKAWIRELRILEWGDSLLQKLIECGLVSDVADLYRLKKEQIAGLDRMADRSAENVLKTLWDANPVPLESFLGGLSIPLCATSIIKLVIDAGYDTLEKIQTMPYARLLEISGLGPKRADAIFDGLRSRRELIAKLLASGVKIKERSVGKLTGKSVCFTGKSVRKRAELETLAANAGGSVKGSVGKGLTYLVLADPNSTSSKAEAARKHGTQCISEEDFVSMCE
jgi:DNA ligase (NAD+)